MTGATSPWPVRRQREVRYEIRFGGHGSVVSESPATCSVRLAQADAERCVDLEAVKVPRRRAGALRAVRGSDGVTVDGGRPASGAVDRRHVLQRRVVDDVFGITFEDEVDAIQAQRQRGSRILLQVA